VNGALAAIDDFYARRGLGRANAERADLPEQAPRALDKRAALRWLRAVEVHLSPRDRALASVLFYAGARISEAVGLDVDDVRLSARKGVLRILGKGEKVREVPVHPSCAGTSRCGWRSARTGPGQPPRRRSSSTSAGTGSQPEAPATSWPPWRTRLARRTRPQRTSSGTPSAPRSSALRTAVLAPTWCWSPS
jgi:integrase